MNDELKKNIEELLYEERNKYDMNILSYKRIHKEIINIKKAMTEFFNFYQENDSYKDYVKETKEYLVSSYNTMKINLKFTEEMIRDNKKNISKLNKMLYV